MQRIIAIMPRSTNQLTADQIADLIPESIDDTWRFDEDQQQQTMAMPGQPPSQPPAANDQDMFKKVNDSATLIKQSLAQMKQNNTLTPEWIKLFSDFAQSITQAIQ